MRRILARCLLAVLSLMGMSAHAVDGFYGGVRFQIDVSPGSDSGQSLLIQSDGKLLLAGACNPTDQPYDETFCATRLRPDGSYDPGFGPAGLGYVTFRDFPGFPSSTFLSAAAMTADGGSVLVGYHYSPSDGNRVGVIAKLTAAGVLDPGVGGGLGWRFFVFTLQPTNPDNGAEAVAVQADGKIVVVGSAKRNDQNNIDFGVARFTANLSYDSGFGDGGVKLVAFDLNGASGGGQDDAAAVAIQADGKIVVAGDAYFNDSHSYRAAVARLTANGQLDSDGFGDGGRVFFDWGVSSSVHAVVVDRDGTLLIAGTMYGGIGPVPSNDFVVSRLATNGSLATGFGPPCTTPPFCFVGPVYINFGYGGVNASHDVANAIAVQSDGKIVLVGSAQRSSDGYAYFAAARVTRNGDLDSSFGSGGISGGNFGPNPGLDDEAHAVAIGNGGIMIAGESHEASGTKYRFGISRLQLDLVFTSGFQ